MMTNKLMNVTERNDADLVAESLSGSRDAFRVIVERYQTLICSLAYNATGNLSQSEDVAQETFVAAWKDLRSLREPAKLRAWLCAILRNRTFRSMRAEGRDPVCNAAPLEHAQDTPMLEALPSEQAITREEEAILWRSLEKIPELYREPLILFYRQHKSIESVAKALELSEDAVKQRLARGRKLLQEEVQLFVENTLGRTSPSHAFSGAVLSALPVMPTATLGMGAAGKGAAAAKSGLLLGILLPFAGFFAGFASQWVLVSSTTPERERRGKLLELVITWVFLLGIPILGESGVATIGQHFDWNDRMCFISRAIFWAGWCFFLAFWLVMVFRRELVMRWRSEQAGGNLRSPVAISQGKSVFIVVGMYLTMFSWLIALTLREQDKIGAALLVGTVVVLGIWNFIQQRDKAGVAAAKVSYGFLTLSCALVVAFINLRLDVWAASHYGVSVAEVHHLLPFWIVPTLTLALAAWVGILLAVTKPELHSTSEGRDRGV